MAKNTGPKKQAEKISQKTEDEKETGNEKTPGRPAPKTKRPSVAKTLKNDGATTVKTTPRIISEKKAGSKIKPESITGSENKTNRQSEREEIFSSEDTITGTEKDTGNKNQSSEEPSSSRHSRPQKKKTPRPAPDLSSEKQSVPKAADSVSKEPKKTNSEEKATAPEDGNAGETVSESEIKETDMDNDSKKSRSRHGRRRRAQKAKKKTVVPENHEEHYGEFFEADDGADLESVSKDTLGESIFLSSGIENITFMEEIPFYDIGIEKDTDINNDPGNNTGAFPDREENAQTLLSPPELRPVPEETAEKQTEDSVVKEPGERAEEKTRGKTEEKAKTKAVAKKKEERLYDPSEFAAVQMMESLSGFAPLGLLFVLMDILNGVEEGLIRVNRLALALGIGKPALLAQLENLEKADLIRTVSSSQRGRHIELLVPNLLTHRKTESPVTPPESAQPIGIPAKTPPGFSLETLRALYSWLTVRGIRVLHVPDESEINPGYSQIAGFLGKYLPYVQPFYARLKATLNNGEEIRFSLLGHRGRHVTHILNFCKMLRDIGLLSEFTYLRAPHCKIVARLNRTPVAINFLSGGWLEHYIRDRVVSILSAHPATHDAPYAFLKNPHILLPGDENFEFDFLLMVADRVFWIEAKTGDYLEFLPKYSRVSKLLGLGRNNSLLVLVDAPPPDATLSARYGLNCCAVGEFAEVFRISLVRELGRQKPGSRKSIMI